jgi:uncharacterized OB-fold protein
MIYSAPRSGRETTPHWQAANHGRLVMPYCRTCARFIWPAAITCHACGGALDWKECSGAGTVVTYSIVHRPVQPEWKDAAPYVVAIIELVEGVRLLSNVVDCSAEELRCGLPVCSRFVKTTDPELGLPVFSPTM